MNRSKPARQAKRRARRRGQSRSADRGKKGFEGWDPGGAYHQDFGRVPSIGMSLPGVARPYTQNPWVRIAASLVATSAAGVPLRLTRDKRGGDEFVKDGPALERIEQPAPGVTMGEFIKRTIIFDLIQGGHAWIKRESDTLGRAQAVEVESLQRLTARKDNDGQVRVWEHSLPDGRREMLLPSDVIMEMEFNPYEPGKPACPLDPIRSDIRNERAMGRFIEASFRNHAAVDTWVGLSGRLSGEQRKFFNDLLWERHAGVDNARVPLVLEGGGKAGRLSQTPQEMDYTRSRDFIRGVTAGLFNVPYEMVQGRVSSSLNISKEATLFFWDNAVMPRAAALAEAFRIHVLQPFESDLYCWFDWLQVPALMERFVEQINSVLKLAEAGFPINQLNERFDLGFKPVAWGDDWWIQIGKLPARVLLEEAETLLAAEDLPEGEEESEKTAGLRLMRKLLQGRNGNGVGRPRRSTQIKAEAEIASSVGVDPRPAVAPESSSMAVAKAGETVKRNIYRRWDRTLRPLEKTTERKVRGFFEGQAKRIAEALSELGPDKSFPVVATKHSRFAGQRIAEVQQACEAFDELLAAGEGACVEHYRAIMHLEPGLTAMTKSAEIINLVFNIGAENRKFRTVLKPQVEQGAELGVRQGLSEVAAGLAASERARQVGEILSDPAIREAIETQLTEIPEMVNTVTRARVHSAIVKGLSEGQTLSELAGQIAKQLPGGFRRAATIARTEVGSAVRSGLQESYRKLAPQARKKWLSARDENVRDSHREAESRYEAQPIKMDGMFEVEGDRMAYPGGPGASAKNKINERCRQVAVVVKVQGRRSVDATWGTYAEMTFLDSEQMEAQRAAEAASTALAAPAAPAVEIV